jgi:hypothetical protein
MSRKLHWPSSWCGQTSRACCAMARVAALPWRRSKIDRDGAFGLCARRM